MSLTHSMFRKNYERTGDFAEFKPYFYRYIGVKEENNYNNVLKTLNSKCKENENVCLVFDNNLPLQGEMELIQYIFNELNNMNIYNLANEDISILEDSNQNQKFLIALENVVNLALKNESFFNDSARNNFITKLIVWAYSYLKKIDYDNDINPKCIYYGTIEKHSIYFLIMLYKMGFDVVYINPLKEEYFSDIDIENLSVCEKYMGILNVENLEERSKKGTLIDNVESITKQIQREVQEQLFDGTGMFMPWQYRDGNTKSILIDGIPEDILSYWNEGARLRPGFKVKGKIVTVPCLFKKLDGVYKNKEEYQKMVNCCAKSENTLFFNSGFISEEAGVSQDMYSLMFCQLSDGSFDINEIKKSKDYKFGKYSEEVQNFLLNKFNEAITDKSVYTKELDKETRLKLLVLILTMNEQIVRLIDNFDFTSNIPKITIFLNNEDRISDNILMLLGYLHTVGVDIVIFNPSGLLNITNVLNNNIVNISRLEEMSYNTNYRNIGTVKQGFLSRILNK
ncbi:YceG family protein [uncultured Clostridium sp.]|uniref:YceG family protein n=1 Tax=uncultured Clostridium sp. TaxID=59620 RepID=UPI00260D0971|nr:YceG family protein [uncultured Clostridium sp.]